MRKAVPLTPTSIEHRPWLEQRAPGLPRAAATPWDPWAAATLQRGFSGVGAVTGLQPAFRAEMVGGSRK